MLLVVLTLPQEVESCISSLSRQDRQRSNEPRFDFDTTNTPCVKMPNYYEKEIDAFKAAKIAEERGARRTPKKASKSKIYTVSLPGEEKKIQKFTHQHHVDENGFVFLSENGISKPTLANDSPTHHEYAKMHLFNLVTRHEGEAFLDTLKNVKNPDSKRGKLAIQKAVKNELSIHFDLGREFIDEGGELEWDLPQFCRTALAYAQLYGGRRTTLTVHREVLQRHGEMLNLLMRQAFAGKDKAEMLVFMQSHDQRADELEERMNDRFQKFEAEFEAFRDEAGAELDKLRDRVSKLELGTSQQNLDPRAVSPERGHLPPGSVGMILTTPVTEQAKLRLAFGKPENELVSVSAPFVTGHDFRTLEPDTWLNDTIVNRFFDLLGDRSKKFDLHRRCVFFSCYFLAKIMDGGNMKKWLKKKVGDTSIFDFDLLFFPVNKHNAHWALLVVDMNQQEIKAYDSARSSCHLHLKALKQFLEQVHLEKHGIELPQGWRCTDTMIDTNVPRQENGYDCGIFVCMYAYFLSLGLDFNFDQDRIYENECRSKIGMAILEGKVL